MGIGPSLEDLLPEKEKTDKDAGDKLQEKIQEIAIKDRERETENKSQAMGLQYIDLSGFIISTEAIILIDKATSKKIKAVCFFNDGKNIRIGAIEPTNEVKQIADELIEKKHANVEIYLISEHSLNIALKFYESLPEIREVVRGVKITEADLKKFEKEIKNFDDLNKSIQKVSITEMVAAIISSAAKFRSSDIHIEAEEKEIKVRYRIDGVLNDVATLKKEDWPQISSRIKQLAKLKINITDQPQDGRFSIFMTDDRIDVRVSSLPTAFGESIVIRLLMSSNTGLSFEDLGLRDEAFKILERETKRPNGMIITTGPTGSGKTTTLYSILTKLNNPKTKIITMEDPIEYELKGINQSQANEKYQFAQGLRSIVRQDPDVIMIGEIRDLETAEIAIQAALTGHLVLSTIHTNDAFGAIPRFLALGAKLFLLAPALNVIVGQRLVRRICSECKIEDNLNDEMMNKIKDLLEKIPENYKNKFDINKLKFYKSDGCEACQGLGYKGRIGIYEIMPISDKMKDVMSKGEMSEGEVRQIAIEEGVISMAQDGILKALDGITSISEIFRVSE